MDTHTNTHTDDKNRPQGYPPIFDDDDLVQSPTSLTERIKAGSHYAINDRGPIKLTVCPG